MGFVTSSSLSADDEAFCQGVEAERCENKLPRIEILSHRWGFA
jgi:hypothetical protein